MDGEISNVHATGNHILQTDGGTAVTIGKTEGFSIIARTMARFISTERMST